MKRWMALVLVLGLAVSSYGALLEAGMSELSLMGRIDLETGSGTLYEADVTYAYMMMDFVGTGAKFSLNDSDEVTFWALGPYAEYNIDVGGDLIPFVGAAIQYVSLQDHFPGGRGEETFMFSLLLGARYYVTDNVAVSGAFNMKHASDEIFLEGAETKSSDETIEIGLTMFW